MLTRSLKSIIRNHIILNLVSVDKRRWKSLRRDRITVHTRHRIISKTNWFATPNSKIHSNVGIITSNAPNDIWGIYDGRNVFEEIIVEKNDAEHIKIVKITNRRIEKCGTKVTWRIRSNSTGLWLYWWWYINIWWGLAQIF